MNSRRFIYFTNKLVVQSATFTHLASVPTQVQSLFVSLDFLTRFTLHDARTSTGDKASFQLLGCHIQEKWKHKPELVLGARMVALQFSAPGQLRMEPGQYFEFTVKSKNTEPKQYFSGQLLVEEFRKEQTT